LMCQPHDQGFASSTNAGSGRYAGEGPCDSRRKRRSTNLWPRPRRRSLRAPDGNLRRRRLRRRRPRPQARPARIPVSRHRRVGIRTRTIDKWPDTGTERHGPNEPNPSLPLLLLLLLLLLHHHHRVRSPARRLPGRRRQRVLMTWIPGRTTRPRKRQKQRPHSASPTLSRRRSLTFGWELPRQPWGMRWP